MRVVYIEIEPQGALQISYSSLTLYIWVLGVEVLFFPPKSSRSVLIIFFGKIWINELLV